MKKLFITLGIISAILALVLAILPLEKIAIIPAIAAFIFGILAMLKKSENKLIIKLIFVLTIVSIVLITYKSLFATSEVVEVDAIETNDKDKLEGAKDDLEDLEIEE